MEKLRIFELTGLPGSGKTTLLNGLKEQVDAATTEDYLRFIEGTSAVRKLLSIAKFALRNVHLLYYLGSFMIVNWDHDAKVFERTVKLIKFAAYIELFIKSLEKEDTTKTVIFDQGLLQDLWAIMLYTKNKKTDKLDKIIEIIMNRYPITCFHLEVDYQTSIERMHQRRFDGCPLDVMEEEEIYNLFKNKGPNFKMILNRIKDNRVLKLPAGNDFDENYEIIKRAVANHGKSGMYQ